MLTRIISASEQRNMINAVMLNDDLFGVVVHLSILLCKKNLKIFDPGMFLWLIANDTRRWYEYNIHYLAIN